ncbi:hypothetical protein GCM10028807_08220 [Spirosoma daeguense]
MLAIMNEARSNPNYRKQQGCKTALNLPSNLKPFFMDDRLTKTAQEQADYQSSIKEVTHDNRNYRAVNRDGGYGERISKYLKNFSVPEACAGSTELADYPIGWMKSETHYRPTWNLDGDKSTAVGFGFAKNPQNNYWYFTAVWANIDESAAVAVANQNSAPPTSTPPASGNGATLKTMKPGDKLREGDRLVSANGNFQLRGTPDGNFIIEDIRANRVIYTFPLAGPINNPPAVSFLSYNPDGNICIESKQNKGYCATNGRDAVTPVIIYKSDRAVLTDNGRFVLVDKQNKEIWVAK